MLYGTQEFFYLSNIHFVWMLCIQISTSVALVVIPVTPMVLAITLRVPIIVSVATDLLEMVSSVYIETFVLRHRDVFILPI